ncbi:MAG TPA: hypothetical protein VIE17_06435 [Methylophilaceae bacterium]|jgi:hypothetical protein
MKTIMRKIVLFPLLALLATAPICNSARADGPWFTLGLGWWILPVAVGGVALYEIGRAEGSGSSPNATYMPETVYVQEKVSVQPDRVYVQPERVYYQQADTAQPAYYQYGYVLQNPQ